METSLALVTVIAFFSMLVHSVSLTVRQPFCSSLSLPPNSDCYLE